MSDANMTHRRTVLKATGALGAAAAGGLAGCLGGGGGAADKGDADLREELDLPELEYLGDVEDKLNVLQWANYFPEDFIPNFETAFGVTVNVTNIASNEELYNKLKAGGTGQYDLIFPTDHMLNTMARQEMIQPLDLDKIPNYDNLNEEYQDPDFDPDPGTFAAPWQTGNNGIGYSEEVLGEDATVDSWDALWNDEWEGQITMLDNMRGCIGAALQRLGYSMNSIDEGEVEEAKETLIQQKPLLLAYDSTIYDNLANAQSSPGYGWSGDVLRARFETMEDGHSPVHYILPKEGSSIWMDSGAIPDGAKNANAAHAFITYYLTPKIGASVSNFTRYATPNDAALEHMDDDIREAVKLDPDTIARLEYYEDISDGIRLYEEAWAEVQNA